MAQTKAITGLEQKLLPKQEEYCFYHESHPERYKGATVDGRSYKAITCDRCKEILDEMDRYRPTVEDIIKRSRGYPLDSSGNRKQARYW